MNADDRVCVAALQLHEFAKESGTFGFNTTRVAAGEWEHTFEIPMSSVLRGSEIIMQKYSVPQSASYRRFDRLQVQECFLNLLEGKSYDNRPQFSYSLETHLLNECDRPSQLSRSVAIVMEDVLGASGIRTWSNMSNDGALTTWNSVPDQLPSMMHNAYTSSSEDDPELLACMESWLENSTGYHTTQPELQLAAASLLREAINGCGIPER